MEERAVRHVPVDWSIEALADKLDDQWDMQEYLDSQLFSENGWNKENGMIESTRFDLPARSAPQALWNASLDDLPEEEYRVCGVCGKCFNAQWTDQCVKCNVIKCMGCDGWHMSTQVTVQNVNEPVCLSCTHK